jgi:hypothetical protein
MALITSIRAVGTMRLELLDLPVNGSLGLFKVRPISTLVGSEFVDLLVQSF